MRKNVEILSREVHQRLPVIFFLIRIDWFRIQSVSLLLHLRILILKLRHIMNHLSICAFIDDLSFLNLALLSFHVLYFTICIHFLTYLHKVLTDISSDCFPFYIWKITRASFFRINLFLILFCSWSSLYLYILKYWGIYSISHFHSFISISIDF